MCRDTFHLGTQTSVLCLIQCSLCLCVTSVVVCVDSTVYRSYLLHATRLCMIILCMRLVVWMKGNNVYSCCLHTIQFLALDSCDRAS
jgi:hypothetical protein